MKSDYYQDEYEQIPGFSAYGVTYDGQVVNVAKGGIVLPHYINRAGHNFVSMKNDEGVFCTRHVAKMVLKAFKPIREESWNTVIYLDGNKSNCHIENLEWRPRWFAVKYNLEKAKPLVGGEYPVRDEDSGDIYHSVRDASSANGILEEEILRKLGTPNRVYPTHQLFTFA